MKKTNYILNIIALTISLTALFLSYASTKYHQLGAATDVVVETTEDVTPQEDIERKKTENHLVGAANSDLIKHIGYLKEVDGGLYFNTSVALPPCEDSVRGVIWFIKNTDTPDELLVCTKIKDGSSIWRVI
jgi:hypothetical protein